MSIWNSMLSWVEHEKSFITLGPALTDLDPNCLLFWQYNWKKFLKKFFFFFKKSADTIKGMENYPPARS